MTVPNRELSQFGSFVTVDDDSRLVSIGTTLQVSGNIGIGTSSILKFDDTNIKIGNESTAPNNTSGNNNTFVGKYSGYCNNIGNYNNFFGAYSGRYNTSGNCNNFFGCRAGESNTTGTDNVALGGHHSLYCNNNGNHNISIGSYTYGSISGTGNFLAGYASGYGNNNGMNNSSYNNFIGWYSGGDENQGSSFCNNFIGYKAGGKNANSCNNNFFGTYAGYNNIASCNNFIGYVAGLGNTSGFYNNFVGAFSGYCNTTGYYNSFFGSVSGRSNLTGNSNSFFGFRSGFGNISGSYNVFFGYNAGCINQTGSQNIVIGPNRNAPTINGSNQLVIGAGNTNWINGNNLYNVGFGTTNPTSKIHVVGDARVTGSVTANSFIGDGSGLSGLNYWEKTTIGINTSSRVGVGTTNPSALFQVFMPSTQSPTLFGGDKTATTTRYDDGTLTAIPGLQHSGTFNQAAGLNLFIYGNGASNGGLIISKSRNSLGTQGLVQRDDKIGSIIFNGSDGVNFQTVSKVSGEVDGTPSTGNMPGRLVFYTTPSGTGVSTERLRISNAGDVGIGTTNPRSKLHIVGDVTLSSLNGGQLAGTRNRIINGSMMIDQRNSGSLQTITAGAALAYTVDRWYAYCTGANVTGIQTTTSGISTGGVYNYKFTGAASVASIGFGQRIESKNSADLAGSYATLSVDLSNSTLSSVGWAMYYANGVDTFGTIASPNKTIISSGNFTVGVATARYSTTVSVPPEATTGIEILFTVGAQTSGSWTIGNVQLETGTVATTFERRHYSQELALCQRYYETDVIKMLCYQTGGAAFDYQRPFVVQKRSVPTISFTGVSYLNASSISSNSITTGSFNPYAVATSLGTCSYIGTFIASSEL